VRVRSSVVVLATALVLLLVAGCGKKQAGGPCKGTEQLCADKDTALVCRTGTFSAIACGGPMKCAKGTDHVSCDTSIAAAAAPCIGEDDESACSPDKQHALACRDGRFEETSTCLGANGCSMLGRTPSCDTSIAAKGNPCAREGAMACSQNKDQMLTCRGGHFEAHRFCRGKLGCVLKSEGPSCDESLSQPGDPCGVAGQIVCSVDGKTELVCQGGVFSKTRTCKTACTITSRPGRAIECN